MDRIQNYPDSFGSDLYPLRCKRGLSNEDRDIKSKIVFKEVLMELKERINNIAFGKGTATTRFRIDYCVYF